MRWKTDKIEKKRKKNIYIYPKSTRPLTRKEIKTPHLQSEFLLIHVQVVHETETEREREHQNAIMPVSLIDQKLPFANQPPMSERTNPLDQVSALTPSSE